jgi:hypothetical protein
MGIRINSAIAYGVQFTAKEARLYEKAMKDKPRHFLLMRWVEAALALSNKHGEFHYHDCSQAYDFIKFNKKTQKPLKPYRPFWVGMSKKTLKTDLMTLATENLEAAGRSSEVSLLRGLKLWEPDTDGECKPPRILAFVEERNYDQDVDYGWVDFLGIEGVENRIIHLKGRRPWECGTERYKKKEWHTCNGQNLIPQRNLPKDPEERATILRAIIGPVGGTKAEFIRRKKEIWDKYHGDMKPYPIYYGDGWYGTDYHFYPAEVLFKTVADLVPGIKFDVMRLEKLLCLYWS